MIKYSLSPFYRQDRVSEKDTTTPFWCKEFLSRGSAEKWWIVKKKRPSHYTHCKRVCVCLWYLTDDLLRGDALLHYASADTSTSLADFEKIQSCSLFFRGEQTSSLPPRPVCLSVSYRMENPVCSCFTLLLPSLLNTFSLHLSLCNSLGLPLSDPVSRCWQ